MEVRRLPSPNVKELADSQSLNALSPMDVTLSGMVMEVRALHKQNVFFSMDMMALPRVTDSRDKHR